MKEVGGIARPLTPTLSRLRERELLLPQPVGWVERSDTHQLITADGYRCAPSILQRLQRH